MRAGGFELDASIAAGTVATGTSRITVAGAMSYSGRQRALNVWLSIRITRTPSVRTALTGTGGVGRDTATAPNTSSGMTASNSAAGTGDCPEASPGMFRSRRVTARKGWGVHHAAT
jgi:hypothetical protein